MDKKKVIFSGIQPTGNLHLGNYLGAVVNWKKLEDEYECFYCVVDLHALTQDLVPAELRKSTLDMIALYLACGLDPKKNTLFVQSHVDAHYKANWLLSCLTYFGELSRMTQFKDKSARQSTNINAGLFTYPILMACDIFLYQTDLVPVGNDQKQHVELARDIAIRFNNKYSDTLTVPEIYMPKTGARIMSLTEPDKKMSKSNKNVNSCIYLLDDRDTIIRKFKKAVTDSEAKIDLNDRQLGIRNLLDIYSAVKGIDILDALKEFEDRSYSELKLAVGETVADSLIPIQQEYYKLLKDKEYLHGICKEGSQKASYVANKTLRKISKKMGLLAL